MPANPSSRTFAVLVDGDNAPADVLKPVLLEVEKHGEARVRLVLGTGSALQGHNENANMYGFRPILQFNVATKKNHAKMYAKDWLLRALRRRQRTAQRFRPTCVRDYSS